MACHGWIINSFSISGEARLSPLAAGPPVLRPFCLFLRRCFVPNLGLRQAAGTGVHICQVLVQDCPIKAIHNNNSPLH